MAVIDDTNIEQAFALEQLYVGDLFGDRAFPWAWSEVERIALMYTSFIHRLCGALLIKGDTQTAIQLLKKHSVNNELNEESLMLYMKALALQKNKEALIRLYMQFRETLHREMEISPSLEVTALYRQLLSGLDT
jgi:two-component system LytT family response regulator